MDSHETEGRKIPLSLQERIRIDYRVCALRPHKVTAYILCVLLGVLGAHRFYLGERQTGTVMFVLGITIIGLPVTALWAVTDLFRIPGMIRRRDEEIRARLTAEATA